MNKKVFLLLIFSFLLVLLISSFVSSLYESTNILGITPESGVKLTEKWQTLGTEWKTNLMQNSFIRGVDSFFQKINFFFAFLFGTDYSLSLSLFLIIVFWVFFFLIGLNILGNTIFSKWVAVLISFGLAVGAAQLSLFQIPANLIIGLFFGEKPWWVKLIIGVVIFAVIVAAFIFVKQFGKQLAESKKKLEEKKNRIKLATGAKAGEELSKAVSK